MADIFSAGVGLLGSIGGLFGGGDDAADDALDAQKEQYETQRKEAKNASRFNLALLDPIYQSTNKAYNQYLQAIGAAYTLDDPVLTTQQHQSDNYFGVNPDGSTFLVSAIPGYDTEGQPLGGSGKKSSKKKTGFASTSSGSSGGGKSVQDGVPDGEPIATIDGIQYYARDEESLMPYNWEEATGYNPNAVEELAGPFREDPGYKFKYDEGLRAIDNSAASRGMAQSGAALKELERYGQGVADQEYDSWLATETQNYNDWLNRLAGVAGQAQTATSAVTGNRDALAAGTTAAAGNLANNAATRGATESTASANRQSSYNQIANSLGTLAGTLF